MSSLRKPLVAAVSAMLIASGCVSMAPTYERPAAPVHPDFSPLSGEAELPAVVNLAWNDVFLDPKLQQLIARALTENRDLRVAVLSVEQARAQYRIQRAQILPSVSATASQTRSRVAAITSPTGASGVGQSAAVEVGFSAWELDLFGRVRSLSDQAIASYFATMQGQRAARLSLVAEVAAAWLAVSADQQLADLARQTVESQLRTLHLTEQLHAQGVASGLELAQVQTSVERARVDLARFSTQLAQSQNALTLIVGAPVERALLPDRTALETGVVLAVLPSNVSSDALLQRPDIQAAEFTLQAANASIGAARAAFFPSISLTASTGRASDSLSRVFDGGNRTWSFAPSVSIPIFRAGALRAELDVAKIQKRIEIANYESSIQTAFAEAADALDARDELDTQAIAQRALVDASSRAYSLADARYRAGASSYIDALDAQRTLYAAEQELISLRLTEANNRVTLYKVFGGGADADASRLAGERRTIP